jgi:cystathionine gamma-synthase
MDLSRSTLAVTAGRPEPSPGAALNVPVVMASTYRAGGDLTYGRDGNPTWSALEQAVGALDGGHAVTFPSGMAALAAVLGTIPLGGTVVAPRSPYTGTADVLREHHESGRLAVRWVDVADADAVVAAIPGADLVWVESATNPLLDVADVARTCAAAHAVGATAVIDSTFTTPMALRPLELGADMVMHSATKLMSGHSDLLLGVVVARDATVRDHLADARHLSGSIPGPFEAWLALRGLRTLALRHERATASAGQLALRLSAHAGVSRVRYPGLPDHPGHDVASAQWDSYGSMISIEVAGDADAAEQVCRSTNLWAHATSLGGVESTLERRRRWPTESSDVPETLIRLSVGIENVEDLWSDLSQALDDSH